MKRSHADEPFSSDEDFEQAMAREVDGFQYFSDDSEFEHAMVRSLDRTEQLGVPSAPCLPSECNPLVGAEDGGRLSTIHSFTLI